MATRRVLAAFPLALAAPAACAAGDVQRLKYNHPGHTTSPTIARWGGGAALQLLIGAEDGFLYLLRRAEPVAVPQGNWSGGVLLAPKLVRRQDTPQAPREGDK